LPSIEAHSDRVEFNAKDIGRLLELLSSKESRLWTVFPSKQALDKFKKSHFL
jgi:hypothetical protein